MSNTQPPLVSIITPVYNGEAYLRECIESVLRQTYQNWEYIIVNNQSEDATLTIAEECIRGEPRIRVITNKEFVGQVANQNIGIRQMSSASEFCPEIASIRTMALLGMCRENGRTGDGEPIRWNSLRLHIVGNGS